MTRFLYAANIGTLALWLSVAGFGGVGIAVHAGRDAGADEMVSEPYDELVSIALTEDFDFSESPAAPLQTDVEETIEPPVTLESPPEMPEVADLAPLPEVPDLPAPVAKAVVPPPTAVKPRTTARPQNSTPGTGSTARTQASGGRKSGAGTRQNTAAPADANRLSGGRTPAPSYPAEARSRGQTGTVLVEFVVGTDGRVVSAYARRPSPWPLLNERAVSTVLRWKFRPGSVAKFTKPIIFKLN